jgi:hypothetical protein
LGHSRRAQEPRAFLCPGLLSFRRPPSQTVLPPLPHHPHFTRRLVELDVQRECLPIHSSSTPSDLSMLAMPQQQYCAHTAWHPALLGSHPPQRADEICPSCFPPTTQTSKGLLSRATVLPKVNRLAADKTASRCELTGHLPPTIRRLVRRARPTGPSRGPSWLTSPRLTDR